MAIFSRRTIQRLLKENASFLNKEQLENFEEKLNNGDLSFEWEIVLLNVFGKLGKVTYEPIFENSTKKLDILFSSQNEDKSEFLADITTVSDYFAESENPLGYLEDKLFQIKVKNNLPGSFEFQVRGNSAADAYLKKKQKLSIPNKTDFDKEVFNKDFKAFINEIFKEPHKSKVYHLKRNEIDLKITYSFNGITHSIVPSYKEILTLKNNTIWNALSDKYKKQLKKVDYAGHLGIILCDGDCESLKDISASWYGKTSGDVIRYFLRVKSKVSFVLMLYIKHSHNTREKHEVVCRVFKGVNYDNNLDNFFSYFQRNIEKLFPIPEQTAANALNFIKTSTANTGISFFGEGMTSRDEIKISSRTLFDLLSGKITYDEFPEEYKNYFKRRVSEGKLIDEIEIEKAPNEKDDDWLTIKFGETDAAVSPFKIPDTNK